jgi:hypothetical protein
MSQRICTEIMLWGYLTVSQDDLWGDLVKGLSASVGFLYSQDVRHMIYWANSAYLQKRTPGSWPAEETIRLVPGLDFPLPRQIAAPQISEWTCVREILDEAGVEESSIMYKGFC